MTRQSQTLESDGHDESKVTLQGEKPHPCDIQHQRHSVHTGHYLQTLKVSPTKRLKCSMVRALFMYTKKIKDLANINCNIKGKVNKTFIVSMINPLERKL